MGRLSLFNVCVFIVYLHKQWSFTVSIILMYHGSPDPTSRNKDKFGRLRSVCHSVTPSFEPRRQNKKQTNMENGENKDLQGRREFFKEAAKKAQEEAAAKQAEDKAPEKEENEAAEDGEKAGNE